jgi:outer membrane protein assembly factor BamB
MQMKYRISLLLFVPLILGSMHFDTLPTDDWICYKRSPERPGSSHVSAPDTCYLLWEVDTGSELYASPVVSNGKVFQVAKDMLYCIDLNTGDVLWISEVPVYQSTPFISDGRIIVATNRGISALSVENGDVIWEYILSGRFRETWPLRDYIVSSPAVSEDKIVIGTMTYHYLPPDPITLGWPDEMHVICLDKTGKEEWFVETNLGVQTSPCVVDGKVFASSRGMMCIDLETGDVEWNSEDKYPWDIQKPIIERYAFRHSTPAMYHGIVVAGSSSGQWVAKQHNIEWQKVVFIDQYTGNILWEWREEGVLASSPAVYQGNVYIYSLDGMVRCVSFLEGEELWKTSISEPVEFEVAYFRLWPSPTVADDKVYIGSIEGVFYCLDADTGEVLWMYETGGPFRSAPAVVPGKVLVSSTDGKLYCFGTDPETYRMKAEHYIEEKEYDKAKEFLLKAKEFTKTNQESEEIDQLLDLVNSEMPEYEKKLDKLAETECLMDEADRILWDKKFKKARELYTKARGIYEELDDDFGKKFCERRIYYIEGRIAQQSWIEVYWWVLIVLGCFGIALILLFKKYRRQ